MSIKHAHDIYERVCEFGGKAEGSIQLFEAAKGVNFGMIFSQVRYIL